MYVYASSGIVSNFYARKYVCMELGLCSVGLNGMWLSFFFMVLENNGFIFYCAFDEGRERERERRGEFVAI